MLGDDLVYRMAHYFPEPTSDNSDESTDDEFVEGMFKQFFFGDSSAAPVSQSTIKTANWTEATQFLNCHKQNDVAVA